MQIGFTRDESEKTRSRRLSLLHSASVCLSSSIPLSQQCTGITQQNQLSEGSRQSSAQSEPCVGYHLHRNEPGRYVNWQCRKLVQYTGCKECVQVPILEEHHISEV